MREKQGDLLIKQKWPVQMHREFVKQTALKHIKALSISKWNSLWPVLKLRKFCMHSIPLLPHFLDALQDAIRWRKVWRRVWRQIWSIWSNDTHTHTHNSHGRINLMKQMNFWTIFFVSQRKREKQESSWIWTFGCGWDAWNRPDIVNVFKSVMQLAGKAKTENSG